jgi:prophage antirepressor-like protein
MSAVQNFIFDDDQPHGLRVVLRRDDPWFVAKDICAVLEITNVSQATEALDDDEKAAVCLTYTSSNGVEQGRDTLIVSEGGLYTLILRSRQATTPGSTAHRFRRWVTGELLPQIRKTGSYRQTDDANNWDWEQIGLKLQVVKETRLTLGRKAAAAIWAEIGLPIAGLQAVDRTPATQGVDFVQQFLADCTVEDGNGHVQARMLHQRYAEWARENEAPAMTERALAMCLDALGVEKSRGRVHTYLGIRLKHISELMA